MASSSSNPSKSKMLRLDPKPNQQLQLTQQTRDWLKLPSDVTANILHRIGAVEILENAQKVCTTWRKIFKDPAMWRVINMDNYLHVHARPRRLHTDPHETFRKICKHAVDRSQGQLVEITIVGFCNDALLRYIADRSSELTRLTIACCYFSINQGWADALKKFPSLEELSLHLTLISKEAIEVAGRCCPELKTLKINQEPSRIWVHVDNAFHNEIAIAIGENLRGVRHLELVGNRLTNIGLQMILDGCRRLKLLDLRKCLSIDLEGDLGDRCSEQIDCVKLPNDSLKGCPFAMECEMAYDFTHDPEYDAFFNMC